MNGAGLAAFLVLLAGGCAEAGSNARNDAHAQQDVREAEIACHAGFVALSEQLRSNGAGEGLGDAFDRLRRTYETVPLEGCTEPQRITARMMALHCGRLAAAARRIGNPADARDLRPGRNEMNPAFAEFMSEFEQWDMRLRVMRADLQRMQAAQR